MSRNMLRGAAVLLTAVLLAGRAHATDVTEVLAQARQALDPGKDMRANVTLVMTNANGESVEWDGRLYRKGGSDPRLRLVLDSPLDLRGTDITVWPAPDGESQTRVYLPAIRRTRDILADMRGESFLGTDFNYEDLGLQHIGYHQHTLTSDGEIGGRPCYQVESVPERGWWYGRVVRCIDKKTFIPTRTEYYDRSGALWKVREFSDIKTVGGYHTWTRLTMETVPTRTSTSITLTDIAYDTGLSPYLFDVK